MNILAWRTSGPRGDAPLAGPEKSAVRQIAHEVLESLNPEMPSTKPTFKGAAVMDVHTRATNKQPTIPRAGRNELCPVEAGRSTRIVMGWHDDSVVCWLIPTVAGKHEGLSGREDTGSFHGNSNLTLIQEQESTEGCIVQ